MGPFPYEGDEDADLINAGKQTVTLNHGGTTSTPRVFAMIRGGNIDIAILGAMQVSPTATSPTGRCPVPWSRAWAARWTSWPAPGESSC